MWLKGLLRRKELDLRQAFKSNKSFERLSFHSYTAPEGDTLENAFLRWHWSHNIPVFLTHLTFKRKSTSSAEPCSRPMTKTIGRLSSVTACHVASSRATMGGSACRATKRLRLTSSKGPGWMVTSSGGYSATTDGISSTPHLPRRSWKESGRS